MPPLPPLANTVKIMTTWSGPNSTKAANIMWALMGSGWTPSTTNLASLAANVAASWNYTGTQALGVYPTTPWAPGTITCTDNGGGTENQAQITFTNASSGNTNPLPPNCAAVVSWQIPAHYRGGHPRTYLPGPTSQGLQTASGNQWSSAFRTGLATAAGNFLTHFNGLTVGASSEALGCIAHHRNGVLLATPVFYPFSGGIIHGRVDSQRRRLGKESLFL